MNKAVQKYVALYNEAQGSEVEKIKTLIMHQSWLWECPTADGIIIDLLDDRNVTAFDMLEALQGIYDYEGGNAEFKAALIAIEVCLKKPRLLAAAHRQWAEALDEGDSNHSFTLYSIPSQALAAYL